jgi:branched-chain amino acid transport system permease protein
VSAILLNQRYLGRHLPAAVRRPVVLGLNLNDQRVFYYFVLAFLLVGVIATIGMRRSRTGRALIGCRENEALAQAFGINLVRIRLTAFAISGFMAALAGGLFAYAQFGVHGQNFDAAQSINMFLIAVIGGLGSISGPLIGAAYYGVINIFTTNALVALAATGIGVILLLLLLPGGLSDGLYRIRDALLRRVADRYRIDVPSLIADGKARSGERASIAPKQRPGGGKIFVPVRYRIANQWALDAQHRAGRDG